MLWCENWIEGGRDAVAAIALASHQRGPGLTPPPDPRDHVWVKLVIVIIILSDWTTLCDARLEMFL